jgi:hypothetical protein
MQRQCRDEWARLLQNCLEAEDEDAPVQDSFQALKTAEVLAESIARRLAPKYSTRPDESKQSFRFPGHRRLCREILPKSLAALLMSEFRPARKPYANCQVCIFFQSS